MIQSQYDGLCWLRTSSLIVAAVLAVSLCVAPLFAQQPTDSQPKPAKSNQQVRTEKKRASKPAARPNKSASVKSPSVKSRDGGKQAASVAFAEREKAALAFAKQHHPELLGLLEQLRDGKKPLYTKAIRELSGSRERLHKIQERLPERYERDLNNWKLDSRIRLLLARLQMADPSEVDSLRAGLRGLVTKRMDSRLAQLQEEKTKLDDRINKLKDSINQLAGDRTASIDRELKRLERTLPRTRPANKSPRPSIATRKKIQNTSQTPSDKKAARTRRPDNPKKTQDDQ